MYSYIKEEVKTVEGVQNLSSQDLYYAWKWMEEGSLNVSDEVCSAMCDEMCIRGF